MLYFIKLLLFWAIMLITPCKTDNSLQIHERPQLAYGCTRNNIRLDCFERSQNTSRFVWRVNGTSINADNDTNTDYIITTRANNSRLTIQDFTKNKVGLYTCEESSNRGVVSVLKRFNVINATWNLTIAIQQIQYLDYYLISITFAKPPRAATWNVTYFVKYKCLSLGDDFCPQSWKTLSPCSVKTTESHVMYSCVLESKEILLFKQYALRAAARLPCGWKNASSSFTCDIPVMPKFENFKAVAIDHNTVKMSWSKIPLLNDLKNYDKDSIEMIVIIKMSNKSNLERKLKTWDTSTVIHGFVPSTNYTFMASYYLVFQGSTSLSLSTTAGPVVVQIPPKIVISGSAVNQKCLEISNKTGNYYNISWIAPPVRGYLGKSLVVNLVMHHGIHGSIVRLIRVAQKPERLGSIVIIAIDTVTVEIRICNKPGCSAQVYTDCILAAKKLYGKPKPNSFPKYSIIIVSVACVASIILLSFLFWKKRRIRPQRQEAREIPPVEPWFHHDYDEAMPVEPHHYDNIELESTDISPAEDIKHSQMEDQQHETFLEGAAAQGKTDMKVGALQVSGISQPIDAVEFNTRL